MGSPERRPGTVRLWLATVAFGLAAAGCSATRTPLRGPVLVEAFGIAERATASGPAILRSDGGVRGRDGGHSVVVDGQVLWLFGDSFVDGGMRSSTAAWSDRVDPRVVRDVRRDDGEVAQFLPLSVGEVAFNRRRETELDTCCLRFAECAPADPYCRCAPTTDCRTRIAVWPGDGFVTDKGRAEIFFEKFEIGAAPFDFRPVGAGVARYALAGSGAAEPIAVREQLVFGSSEPFFTRGLIVEETGGSVVYLYAARRTGGCVADVLAARVPTAAIADRSSYRFWDGEGWQPDLSAARAILSGVPSGLGAVAWNRYLGAYLSVWSDHCTEGKLLLRTAPNPGGPWSEPVSVDLGAFGGSPNSYYGLWHPAFGTGREILVSFYVPVGEFDGELRLVRLRLP